MARDHFQCESKTSEKGRGRRREEERWRARRESGTELGGEEGGKREKRGRNSGGEAVSSTGAKCRPLKGPLLVSPPASVPLPSAS